LAATSTTSGANQLRRIRYDVGVIRRVFTVASLLSLLLYVELVGIVVGYLRERVNGDVSEFPSCHCRNSETSPFFVSAKVELE
jgi:hypothetical protein